MKISFRKMRAYTILRCLDALGLIEENSKHCNEYWLTAVGSTTAKNLSQKFCVKKLKLHAGYGFSMVFIVIEIFIGIRSLPVGAYETVNWAEFIPHIG